jgi:hypothetical protein
MTVRYVFFVVQGTLASEVAILAALDCVECVRHFSSICYFDISRRYAGAGMTSGLRKRIAEIKTVMLKITVRDTPFHNP